MFYYHEYMKYEKVKMLSNSQFKRLIGIQPSTFLEMLEVLESSQVNTQRGRPSSLSLEDQLLMTLSYWREYRTLFHVAMSYGIHESTASRIIHKIENKQYDKESSCRRRPQQGRPVAIAQACDIRQIRLRRRFPLWRNDLEYHKL